MFMHRFAPKDFINYLAVENMLPFSFIYFNDTIYTLFCDCCLRPNDKFIRVKKQVTVDEMRMTSALY